MKRIFILLLLLTGISGQATWAGDQSADSNESSTQPADSTQDSGGDSKAPKEGQDEAEPDCE